MATKWDRGIAEDGGFENQRVCVSLSIMRGNKVNWRQRIITDWPNDPQRSHKAKAALQAIEDGLLQLASLGHPLHIEEGYNPPPPPEFPKAMFHLYQGSRVFACQADIDEAGDDWYSTMEDARHAAGVTKQNQRGGIFTKALPAMLWRTSEEKANEKALEEEAERLAIAVKRQFISDQRAIHRASAGGNSLNAMAAKMVEAKQEKQNG